jgi:hypothetical protein
VTAYVDSLTYTPGDDDQIAEDRLDASTLSVLARSLNDPHVRSVNEHVWNSGLSARHQDVVAQAVGVRQEVPFVGFEPREWLSVGNGKSPLSKALFDGAAALARPYAVLVRIHDDLRQPLQLDKAGQLDPLLLHEVVHTTQSTRWGYPFDNDPGYFGRFEMALLEGVTEAIARRLAPDPAPPFRDAEAYPDSLIMCEATALLANPSDPMGALIAASNANSCLESFAQALLPETVKNDGLGRAVAAFAGLLPDLCDDVEADIERLRNHRPKPVRLSYLGDLHALAAHHADKLQRQLAAPPV